MKQLFEKCFLENILKQNFENSLDNMLKQICETNVETFVFSNFCSTFFQRTDLFFFFNLEAGWSRRTRGAYRSSQALRQMALRHILVSLCQTSKQHHSLNPVSIGYCMEAYVFMRICNSRSFVSGVVLCLQREAHTVLLNTLHT